jgi:hypothetical protein
MKHEREKENLIKSHETQKTTLLAEIDKVWMLVFSLKLDYLLFGKTQEIYELLTFVN